MRSVMNPQKSLGQTDIASIVLDAKSRDDIPQLLRGLQHIYIDAALRARVFAILAELLPDRVDAQSKQGDCMKRPYADLPR